MSNSIDYTRYNITCTSQFCDGLAQLKHDNLSSEVAKLFRIIDEIILGVDMYEKEYARPLKNTKKIEHIHLDGRKTGDIILLYTVDGQDIDLDLKLFNITDHKNLNRVSAPKYTTKQKFNDFNVVVNKFSAEQIEYVEECYLNLISDPKFHQLKGDKRKQYSESYISDYYNNSSCESALSFDEFMQIISYLESENHKSIFGSLDFNSPQHTAAITDREEQYILRLIQNYGLSINDAYIETEVDEYGDTYESMYVDIFSDNFRDIKLLESEFYSLDNIFGITFDSYINGLGRWGRTYIFSHYFESK